MSCPICGANCQCRKRGPGGLCCSCHRHKPSVVAVDAWSRRGGEVTTEEWQSYEKHKQDILAAENDKSWGDVMAKRKDLRNGRESGSWKPHKWTIRRQRTCLKHALESAYSALCADVGPYNASLINAEVCARVRDAHNADAIHAAGYKTLFDVSPAGCHTDVSERARKVINMPPPPAER
jgi:hypothetical protein